MYTVLQARIEGVKRLLIKYVKKIQDDQELPRKQCGTKDNEVDFCVEVSGNLATHTEIHSCSFTRIMRRAMMPQYLERG